MTLLQLERELKMLLSDSSSDADFEARAIILDIFALSREGMLDCRSDEAQSEKASACFEAANRRRAGEPLQYILGKAYFFGLEFKVTPDCLIPRWDTEPAVSFAAEALPMGGRFAELGTGSGCIAVSLLKAREVCVGDAYDISPKALDIAGHNARFHRVDGRLRLFLRDMRQGAPEGICYNMIISNPPYIPTRDITELEREVRREPVLALDGGEDGLDFYRAILSGWAGALNSGGYFVFEVGHDQADEVLQLLRTICPSTGSIKDINGYDRVVYGMKG